MSFRRPVNKFWAREHWGELSLKRNINYIKNFESVSMTSETAMRYTSKILLHRLNQNFWEHMLWKVISGKVKA